MDDELKRLLEEMRQENLAAHRETRVHAEKLNAETRRHFESVLEHRIEPRIDALAETIATVDAKAERKLAELEERMEREFAETRAVIKFSYADLDRRVRALE